MNATTHPAAERYLKELDRALSGLPRPRRMEIVDSIRDHIEEALPPDAGEAQVRTVLEDLGDPEMIAADARERFGVREPQAGALEGFAIALLLVGGVIVPALGWIIGAVLLWVSRAWTLRDKLIGTLLVPGGLALAVYLGVFAVGASSSCGVQTGVLRPGDDRPRRVSTTICESEIVGPDIWWTMLLAFLAIVPIGTAIYLGRRAWRST